MVLGTGSSLRNPSQSMSASAASSCSVMSALTISSAAATALGSHVLSAARRGGTSEGTSGRMRSLRVARRICFVPSTAIMRCGSAVTRAPSTNTGSHRATSNATSGQPCSRHRMLSAPPNEPLFFSAGKALFE